VKKTEYPHSQGHYFFLRKAKGRNTILIHSFYVLITMFTKLVPCAMPRARQKKNLEDNNIFKKIREI
jgi:hypothetical protein